MTIYGIPIQIWEAFKWMLIFDSIIGLLLFGWWFVTKDDEEKK